MTLPLLRWRVLVHVVVVLGGALGVACTGGDTDEVPFPTDGWAVRDPAVMGMDAALLQEACDYAFAPGMNTQGVVVVRGGAIVAECYAPDRGPESYAASWSAAKSFSSTLIGIAIDEGLIEGVDVPMRTFFPEWDDSPKGDIPLQSVLWMQSGLDFAEDYSDFNSHIVRMSFTSDALGFALDLDVRQAPNTRWYYSSGDTQLLDGVIQRTAGVTSDAYAREKLFEPLGMRSAQWWRDGTDNTFTYCCMDAPTREFAKFGLLFLREGNWDGRQVVSADWVREASTNRATLFDGYAYQWWTVESDTSWPLPDDLYMARGLDSQAIYVIPSLDLVVAKNTLYTKPEGDPVAPDGWIPKFTPRGITPNGTIGPQCPAVFENAGLLAPIINSIEGAPQVDFSPTTCGESPDDPALCRDKASAERYGTYCEEMHGCVCDQCAVEFLDCDGNEACANIMACALETECRGIGCMETCVDVIQANGGTEGAGAQLALHLSECTLACPTACE
jgi:CubicO group peptidase (beta-lactamase class C family)